MNTKDKIFDVALDLFSKKGYDSVSIRKIAMDVGIKESSIYNHYSSKKEILMSILDYFREYFKGNPLDDENTLLLLEKDPLTFYHNGSEGFKAQVLQDKILKILKLIFIQMYQIDEVREFFLKELLNGPLEFWCEIFSILIEKEIIRDDYAPETLAKMYYSLPMFKLWEMFVKFDEFPENEINKVFDEVENYHNFLLSSLRVDSNV